MIYLSYGLNIAGLCLDIIGVFILMWHADKTKGITASWEQVYLPGKHWNLTIFHLGAIFIIFGFVCQIFGNIVGLASP